MIEVLNLSSQADKNLIVFNVNNIYNILVSNITYSFHISIANFVLKAMLCLTNLQTMYIIDFDFPIGFCCFTLKKEKDVY